VTPIPPGYAAVIFGSTTHIPVVPISSFNGVNGMTFTGKSAGNQFGYAVGPAGDYNLDGIDDINVGAFGAADSDGNDNSGAVYVIYGHSGVWTSNFNVASLPATAGEIFTTNIANTQMGIEVWGGFDFNGDGRSDMTYGQPEEDNGYAYIIFDRRGLA